MKLSAGTRMRCGRWWMRDWLITPRPLIIITPRRRRAHRLYTTQSPSNHVLPVADMRSEEPRASTQNTAPSGDLRGGISRESCVHWQLIEINYAAVYIYITIISTIFYLLPCDMTTTTADKCSKRLVKKIITAVSGFMTCSYFFQVIWKAFRFNGNSSL